MSQGWLKLHRKILDWEWYDDTNTFRLFMHLLLTVNYQDKQWRGIDLKAGEILISPSKLGEQIGLSRQQIRTSLNKLKITNQITTQTTKNYTIITVTYWHKYQEGNQPSNQEVTTKVTTTKERKKERKKEIYSVEFEELWKSYIPLDVGKGSKELANKEFTKKINEGESYDRIKQGLGEYIEFTQRTGCKTKQFFRWISKECWNDEYPKPSSPDLMSKVPSESMYLSAKNKIKENRLRPNRAVFEDIINRYEKYYNEE